MNSQTLPEIEGLNVQEPEFIDVDMPFNAREIEKATSKRYVEQLTRSDMPIVAARRIPAEDSLGRRKSRAAVATEHVFDPIDVDMPFSAAEVEALTSEAYVAALGRSDMPIIGHWGQLAPSARKALVVDDKTIAANSIRKIHSMGESFSCKDALA